MSLHLVHLETHEADTPKHETNLPIITNAYDLVRKDGAKTHDLVIPEPVNELKSYRLFGVVELAKRCVPSHVIGFFSPTVPQVLGLYEWNDVVEWSDGDRLITLIDIGKGIRMLLSGSPTIVDYLIVAAQNGHRFAVDLLTWSINHRHQKMLSLAGFENPAPASPETPTPPQGSSPLQEATSIQRSDLLERLRRSLQALLLSHGLLAYDLETLTTFLNLDTRCLSAETIAPDEVTHLIRTAHRRLDKAQNQLPPNRMQITDKPSDYGAISNWLVLQRMLSTTC